MWKSPNQRSAHFCTQCHTLLDCFVVDSWPFLQLLSKNNLLPSYGQRTAYPLCLSACRPQRENNVNYVRSGSDTHGPHDESISQPLRALFIISLSPHFYQGSSVLLWRADKTKASHLPIFYFHITTSPKCCLRWRKLLPGVPWVVVT